MRVERQRDNRGCPPSSVPDGHLKEAVTCGHRARGLIYIVTYTCIHMTTLRLTLEQKETLRKASKILETALGRKVSQGDAVEALAEFALRHRDILSRAADELALVPPDDPFFDLSLTFDLGRTDERSHDRLLYGKG